MGFDKSRWDKGKGDKESSGVQGAGVPQRIKRSDAILRAGKKGGLCKTAN